MKNQRMIWLVILCLAVGKTVSARTLQEVLRQNVLKDPSIAEAVANERISDSRLAQAKAAKWPVVSATGGQRVFSSNKSESAAFNPTLQAKWTLYDFGQQDSAIDRERYKTDYFTNKTAETTEELINQLSGYYLEAVKAKMSLNIAKVNYKRHQEVANKLKIIVEYDPGRRSEYTQAKSRLLKAKEDITNYGRMLSISLLRLSRYVQPAITAAELKDPFVSYSPKTLVKKYGISNESLKEHPSYVAQKNEMSSIEADKEAAERAKWPTVDLIAQVSTEESAVYLNFNVDLFNRTRSPQINEKAFQANAAQAKLDSILRNLDERSKLAELRMKEDQVRLALAKNQIGELKQLARDYEDQFFIAQRSLLDVVNAYRELSSMELIRVESYYDLMTAKLDYLSAVGALSSWVGLDTSSHKPNQQLIAKNSKNNNKKKSAVAKSSDAKASQPNKQATSGQKMLTSAKEAVSVPQIYNASYLDSIVLPDSYDKDLLLSNSNK